MSERRRLFEGRRVLDELEAEQRDQPSGGAGGPGFGGRHRPAMNPNRESKRRREQAMWGRVRPTATDAEPA